MAFEDDFLELMPHSIIVKSYTSMDGYGKPTYSTAGSTYAGRCSYKQKLVRAMDGTQQVSSANVVLNCTGTINPDDKITLPDGTVRPVLSVGAEWDNESQHHVRIFFG